MEEVLSKAEELEKKYEWLNAAELYEQALSMVGKTDFLRRGEIQEKIGFCSHKAAMQAESVKEFRTKCAKVIENYEKAKEFYEKMTKPGKKPRMLRCNAMVTYIDYWLTSDVSEKKRSLDECWNLTKQALEAFEKAGDTWEYGKTYNQLSTSIILGCFLDWDFQAREKTMREAAEYGEQAIRFLSTFGDPYELARAYVKTASALQLFGFCSLDLDERKRPYQKALGYWLKANELSEEIALIELLNSAGMAALENSVWGWGTERTVANFRRALECGRKTKDRFIVGWALDWLDFHTVFLAEVSEDPDEGLELYKRALQYAEDAKQQYYPISFVSPLWGGFWVEAPYAWYYWVLASYETDLRKRRNLLEKAAKAASDQLKRAEDSGYAEVRMYAHHYFSGILFSLAKMETNSVEKKGLLEKALEHRNENIRILKQFLPFYYWKRGRMQALLADIKSELIDLAKDFDAKKSMLQEALLNTENSLKLGRKYLAFWEGKGVAPSLFADLGGWQYGYGDLLNRLYELTDNSEHLRKAIEAFEEATKLFQKVDLMSSMAECQWKIAQAYDTLGEHLKAAENFDLASNDYKKAAERIPQLKDFYQDHALYMEAWSEIEKAKHYHRRHEYGSAKEHFKIAASKHKSLKHWSYLAPNYSAWAQVEHAEELSREEQSEEALKAFEQATQLFNDTKKSLQAEIGKIEGLDEKQVATNVLKTNDLRHEYCKARIALEEAKILDRKGDHAASSRKYGSAAEKLEKATSAIEHESDRQELKPIVNLCRAWQMMTRAEAEASPDLYLEASKLFDKAKEHGFDEKAKTLALGHSSFCKALEAGTRFEAARDMTLYSTVKKHLEAAANYYVKAGFKNSSEYARATHRLFDAYVYMHKADTIINPKKKAQFYQMAEKLLQASAGSYMKAKHPEKGEEVRRLLESVKEERQLAVSLAEVLHAPTITSTTTSFSMPTPTHEQAVGLERFEHADIQANLLVKVKEVMIGDELHFRMELVNAGKAAALLIRVDEIIPKGFEIKEVPETYRVEDSYLNMRGKKLNPLKTEDVKIVVKPQSKGTFPIKPRVLYIDDTGKYRSHEPEPVTITVKELGIRGWIKGER